MLPVNIIQPAISYYVHVGDKVASTYLQVQYVLALVSVSLLLQNKPALNNTVSITPHFQSPYIVLAILSLFNVCACARVVMYLGSVKCLISNVNPFYQSDAKTCSHCTVMGCQDVTLCQLCVLQDFVFCVI